MARQSQAVEVNKFNAGLITDASPLTTPDNSSLDEDNFVLNIDGSRNRRYGMDLEDGHVVITSPTPFSTSSATAVTTFKWTNAGGDPNRFVLVTQVGTTLDFFNLGEDAVSSGHFAREILPGSDHTKRFSFASVDGMLVMVNGDKDVYVFQLNGNIVSRTSRRILIRDFFGVDDFHNGVDITRGNEVANRPTGGITTAHLYNLRNQSWGIPRLRGNMESLHDPIITFNEENGVLPSNADSVVYALYPDAEDADNRVVDRFFSKDLYNNPPGTTRAAQGYYIIDALDRGLSRLIEDQKNRARYPAISWAFGGITHDETPSGATTIAEFAGRVFYGGFPGTVISGDGHSPKLSSYVMFSRLVDSLADIVSCYQAGDPTSKEFPDIIDTDGGFIRVNGAYGIQKLVNLGSALMIIAKNGIWRLVGGSDNGFTATAYIVEKISDKGCTSPDSIVVVDNGVMYWSDDAIYFISPDQFGSWQSSNISFGRIQKFYDDINIEDKQLAYGEYDSYERKVRWLFRNSTRSTEPVRELVLDLQLQAFYTNTIKQLQGEVYPRPAAMYIGLSYQISNTEVGVLANNEQVVVGLNNVIISSGERLGVNQRELGYLVITAVSPTIQYSFAKYSDTRFRDWAKVNGVGVDADGFLVTSYMSGSDFQRDKRIPYITTHMRRTEVGYTENMEPINPSSCLMQARWDWADGDKSGKWGREFQVYRYRRNYLPQDANDDHDNGFSTVITRSKLRGNGKVLSLRFRTEPGKDLHLYGWSMIITVAENV